MAKTDIFGVGIVLWETLAGRKLFDAKSDIEVVRQVAAALVPRIGEIRDDIPPALAEIVHTALAHDPEDRWIDARAMANALHRVLRVLEDPIDADAIAVEVRAARGRLGISTGRKSLADVEAAHAKRNAAVRGALMGDPVPLDDPSGAIPLPLSKKKGS